VNSDEKRKKLGEKSKDFSHILLRERPLEKEKKKTIGIAGGFC